MGINPLFLRTFGSPALLGPSGEMISVRGKSLAVVIYLTLHRGEKFTREQIARIVWGTKIDKSALRSLYEACGRINERAPGILRIGGSHLSLLSVPRCDALDLIDASVGRH